MWPWYVAVGRRDPVDLAFVLAETIVVAIVSVTALSAGVGVLPRSLVASGLYESIALVVALAAVVLVHGAWEWFAHPRHGDRAGDAGSTVAVRYLGTSRVLERGFAALFLASSLSVYALRPWGSGDQLEVPLLGVLLAGFGGLALLVLVGVRAITFWVAWGLSGLDR